MSAGAPTVQVTFAADTATLYAEYNRFLQYVRANPAGLGMGGAAGGIGVGGGRAGGPPPLPGPGGTGGLAGYGQVPYYGPPASGGGGRGGGRGGGAGGGAAGGGGEESMFGGGMISRYFGPTIAAHAAFRMLQATAEYGIEYGGAGSDAERFKAEKSLQQRLFSVPIIGQAAEFLTGGARAGPEHTNRQAEAQERQTDLMERAADSQRKLMEQQSAFRAGATGSYGYRGEEIESRQHEEEQRFRREGAERAKEIEHTKQQEISEARAQADRDKAQIVAGFAVNPALAAYNLVNGGDTFEKIDARQAKTEASARAIASSEKTRSGNVTEDEVLRSQKIKEQQQDELNYQRAIESKRAIFDAQQEKLRYEWKPHVAEASGVGFRGANEAEAARRRGNPEAATAIEEETRWKLMGMRRQWQQEGTAWEVENTGAMFSERADAQRSTDMRGPFGQDDTAEAIAKLDQLIGLVQQGVDAVK